MSIDVGLTPRLQAFIQAELAAGHFQSEEDLVRAAIQLLEHYANSPRSSGAIGATAHVSERTTHGGPALSENAKAQAKPPIRNDLPASKSARRSARGLLADIASHMSPEEFQEARREIWGSWSHREP
jgi:Arc/MetJ-type ribon-helix-helix transcriptional regulator